MPISVLNQLKSYKDLNKPDTTPPSVMSQLNSNTSSEKPQSVLSQLNRNAVHVQSTTDTIPSVLQQLNRR